MDKGAKQKQLVKDNRVANMEHYGH